MKVLVVLAHPGKESLNHAIADVCCNQLKENGHSVVFHDLYEEKFDPILLPVEIPKTGTYDQTIEIHCKEIAAADGIVIVHPNWWGQPPAILKGWIDRVIRPGIAYEFAEGDNGEGVPIGLLKANTALVFNTSNTSEKREIEVFKDPLDAIWKNCIFDLCGVKTFDRRMFRIVITSDLEQRKTWLNEVKIMINSYFPAC